MILFDRWRQEGWDCVWLEFGRIGNGLFWLQARVGIDEHCATEHQDFELHVNEFTMQTKDRNKAKKSHHQIGSQSIVC